MSELPTRAQMLANTAEAIQRASNELSNARDWLKSDWQPVGSELTDEAARARREVRQLILDARAALDEARDTLAEGIRSLS